MMSGNGMWMKDREPAQEQADMERSRFIACYALRPIRRPYEKLMSSWGMTALMKNAIRNVGTFLQVQSVTMLTMLPMFAGNSAMRSDITTMLSHLRKCPLQPADVIDWAAKEYKGKYACSSRLSTSHAPYWRHH